MHNIIDHDWMDLHGTMPGMSQVGLLTSKSFRNINRIHISLVYEHSNQTETKPNIRKKKKIKVRTII